MTALSTLEAYDLLRHCATLSERIARAEVDQLSRAGLEDEKVWLHQALERVEPLLPVIEEMLRRCRELPELAPAREDHAQVVQGAWVDALERLVGALTHHAGSRAPILETLFPHLKLPPLRRASPEVVRAYAADLERRSRLGYVKRIFAGPDFAFVEPLVLAVFERIAEWEACFEPGSLTEEEAAPLRDELAALTATVERQMRQARLLAEASLCPVEGAFEASGIGGRPRRRVGAVEIETPPGLDPEPEDDGVSLVEALGWGGSSRADEVPRGEAADVSDAGPDAERDPEPAPSADAGEVPRQGEADAASDTTPGETAHADMAGPSASPDDGDVAEANVPQAQPDAASTEGAEFSEKASATPSSQAPSAAPASAPSASNEAGARRKKAGRKAKASASRKAAAAGPTPAPADAAGVASTEGSVAPTSGAGTDASNTAPDELGTGAEARTAEATSATADASAAESAQMPSEQGSVQAAEANSPRAVTSRRSRRGRTRAAPVPAPADD